MINPYLKIDTNLKRKGILGYQLSQSSEAIKDAGRLALRLVRKSRQSGATIRRWSEKAAADTHVFLEKFKRCMSNIQPNEEDKLMWELRSWENNILQVLRGYMSETCSILAEIKTLNPPLASSQIKIFSDAVLADRQLTMTSLDMLTKNVEELSTVKAQLARLSEKSTND